MKLTEGEQCPDQTGELDCPVQGTEPNQLPSSPGHEIPPSMPEPAVTVEDLETPNSGLEGVGTDVVVGCSGGDNSKRIEETTCAQVDTSERSKLTTTLKITPHRRGKWAGRLRRHKKVEDRLAEDD